MFNKLLSFLTLLSISISFLISRLGAEIGQNRRSDINILR